MREEAVNFNKNRKGVFLVFALWLFTLLSLFCLGLGFRTYVETRKIKLILNRTRAYYLAVSGVKLAREVIKKDKAEGKNVDYLGEDWVKEISETVKFSSPQKEGKIIVNIEDESSRINVNFADEGLLTKLFGGEEGEGDSEYKAKCVMEYRGAINNTTAEWTCYDPDKDKEIIKGEELKIPEELLLVRSISDDNEDDDNDYNKLKDLITVFGDNSRVNINTVEDKWLFEILLTKAGIVDSDKEDIMAFREEIIDRKKYYYIGEPNKCDNPEDCKELSGNLGDIFKVDSNYFRIISEGEVDNVRRKITCVINRDGDEDKVCYWYEE